MLTKQTHKQTNNNNDKIRSNKGAKEITKGSNKGKQT